MLYFLPLLYYICESFPYFDSVFLAMALTILEIHVNTIRMGFFLQILSRLFISETVFNKKKLKILQSPFVILTDETVWPTFNCRKFSLFVQKKTTFPPKKTSVKMPPEARCHGFFFSVSPPPPPLTACPHPQDTSNNQCMCKMQIAHNVGLMKKYTSQNNCGEALR